MPGVIKSQSWWIVLSRCIRVSVGFTLVISILYRRIIKASSSRWFIERRTYFIHHHPLYETKERRKTRGPKMTTEDDRCLVVHSFGAFMSHTLFGGFLCLSSSLPDLYPHSVRADPDCVNGKNESGEEVSSD